MAKRGEKSSHLSPDVNETTVALLKSELNETRQQLREALEQQTATSEVLRVISRFPGDLEPVFEAVLANATRICEAKCGNLFLYDGDTFRTGALYGAPPGWAEVRQRDPVFKPAPNVPLARVARTKLADAHCGYQDGAGVHRARSDYRWHRGARRRSDPCSCTYAQRGGVDWRNCRISPRGPPVHGQADFAAHELCEPGGNCNRERPTAQRTSAIASATDRNRRRAQGYKSLDLRPAGGASDTRGISRSALRSGQVQLSRGRRMECFFAPRLYGFSSDFIEYVRTSRLSRTAGLPRDGRCWKARYSYSPMCWPTQNTAWAEAQKVG